MKLLYPIAPVSVSQYFGSNGAYYRANGINVEGHNGIDFVTYHSQPVYASHDGQATYQQDENGGEMVAIINKELGIRSIYLHLCDPKKEPQFKSPIDNFQVNSVKAGDLIGYSDSTGFSTGTHLHFGIKLVDKITGAYLNTDNGYGGAIDPMPYFARVTEYQFTKDFGYESTSRDVLELQKRLGVSQTGYFGFLTLVALFRFQFKHGIRPYSGVVHKAVRDKLNT